ncbi:hypothetical protein AOLI_G00008550 [Acnodon oligacanthus]
MGGREVVAVRLFALLWRRCVARELPRIVPTDSTDTGRKRIWNVAWARRDCTLMALEARSGSWGFCFSAWLYSWEASFKEAHVSYASRRLKTVLGGMELSKMSD